MKFIFSTLLLTTIIALNAQNLNKIYKAGENLFYHGYIEDAIPAYEEIVAKDASFKDAAYKLELARLLTIDKDKPLDRLFELRQTVGQTDRFFDYWMGKIYSSRYEFDLAIKSWQKFIASGGNKSDEILAETGDFVDKAEKAVVFYTNLDDYQVIPLGNRINSEGAEFAPVFSDARNELLFASSRGTSGLDETFTIYRSNKEESGWTDPVAVPVLGQFTRSTASLEIVKEDGRLFMFRPDKGGDLFYSENVRGTWSIPVEFDSKISNTHLGSHFFINEHEDRIIFSTDIDYDKNGLDLYESFKDAASGKWSKPAPFTTIINSEFDEDSPYLSADEKTIYFSSKGHGAIGGYDVFKSQYDEASRTWSEPVNMGFPVNSPNDELHFKINDKETEGFMSSNRVNAVGDFDIYYFKSVVRINIEGGVLNMNTSKPVPNAQIKFTPSQYPDEEFIAEVGGNGKYATQVISGESYYVEIIKDGVTVFTDELVVLDTEGEATTYMKNFLVDIPDPEGAVATETTTSQNAETTSIDREQPTERQVDTQLTDNRNNQNNRRTDNAGLEREVQYDNSSLGAQNRSTPSSSNRPVQEIANYSIGRKLIIRNVYFKFGTTTFSNDYDPILQELFETLSRNPSLKIEIGGHTDNIGSKEKNQWVSESRAKRVKAYLVSKGIDPSRLVAKGYGEDAPLATNDDEKEGRELNRRIEIRVIQ
ncbi:MAG: OmpA family protein [Cyclobacteriaceae bacterium]